MKKMKENHSLSLALINLYLFLCRLLLTNSVRLFNRASSANDDALLNKRTELVNNSRHKNKYKLINAKLKL